MTFVACSAAINLYELGLSSLITIRCRSDYERPAPITYINDEKKKKYTRVQKSFFFPVLTRILADEDGEHEELQVREWCVHLAAADGTGISGVACRATLVVSISPCSISPRLICISSSHPPYFRLLTRHFTPSNPVNEMRENTITKSRMYCTKRKW